MNPKDKRPPFVTLLAALVFILSVAGFAGLLVGLARRPVLSNLDLVVPLWLLLAFSGIWGIIWLGIAWGLWRLSSWTRRAAIICFIIYQIVNIGQQGLLARGDYERSQLPFVIGVAVLLSALVTFGLTRPRIRQAFEAHEYESSNG
ncbi:MAG: hypothetical protein JXB07_14605 [Anaerolineae bacterium]|nr:hypothetical protein [Anaerolineae bacterium]